MLLRWTAPWSLVSVLCVATLGCSSKEKEADKPAATTATTAIAAPTEAVAAPTEVAKPPPSESGAHGVPDIMVTLPLNEDGNAIAATIEVPAGSTIFADTPQMLRVEYGDGEKFGVQVLKGNEFNTNLKDVAKTLRETKGGGSNEILEETETMVRYKTTVGDFTTISFNMLVKVGDMTLVCQQGNMGGWIDAQIKQQIKACSSLKAK